MLNATALAWVTHAPREDWGERYVVAHRVAPLYDPARSKLWTFLELCWRRKEINRLRAKYGRHAASARRRPVQTLAEDSPSMYARAPYERPRVNTAALGDGWEWEAARMNSEGVPLRVIAVVLGTPLGTVKSRMHRAHERIRNDPELARSMRGEGC